MEYQFYKRTSKSHSQMIQLKQNIEKGLKCSVATMNPEKTKRQFEYMTGAKLNLKAHTKNKHIYKATLN